jgi:DNA replication protein DnaC
MDMGCASNGQLHQADAVSRWHEQIGDPTLADGILDRLVHNAHRIEMRGDSMRKNRGKPNA